jgi:shikimate kinase
MKQNNYQRVFIIGHPGAGKALLAKTLAEKLGWKFIDTDLGLEFTIGKTINDILGKGIDDFYRCQAEVLRAQLSKEHIVVNTDASVICDEKIKQLLDNEFVVYLQVSTPIQLERTSRHPAPLLLVSDMKTFFDKLHAERDAYFSQSASMTINGDDSELMTHVSRVIDAIAPNLIADENTKLQLEDKELVFFHNKTHVLTRISYHQAICIKLLAQGMSSKEIAKELNISYRTVEGHLANAMELLGCASSKELIALYHEKH